MTGQEHLAWCKTRALEYLDAGDLVMAVTSMGSDLGKHPETTCSTALIVLGMFRAIKDDSTGVRRWIEGFN